MDTADKYDTDGADELQAPMLARLSDVDEFQIADGYPDIRGWDVKTSDGTKVGKVGDLIVDTAAMRVRYLDVEIDRSVVATTDGDQPGEQERHTLLPIGKVELDEDKDDVLVNGISMQQLASMPMYSGDEISREYENSVRSRDTSDTADQDEDQYNHNDYNDQRLYDSRRKTRMETSDTTQQNSDNEQRLTLAEEQMSVGKRQVAAGEVQLRKTVDTEHVQQSVPVSREEVVVERRPIRADAPINDADIGEDEIRMTIMEEQVVVEKKLVPREEIIVRKKIVTEQQTVGTDVRRERLITEGLDEQRNSKQ